MPYVPHTPEDIRRMLEVIGAPSVGVATLPAAMVVVLAHVTTCPVAAQVQPVPVAETKPSPAGKVSVTVMVPVVGAAPTLLTCNV